VALAVLGVDSVDGVTVSAAVSVGTAQVGSTRETREGESRWSYRADGAPVEQAAGLARRAPEAGLVLATDAAALVNDRFTLEPVGDGTYRLPHPSAAERHARRAGPASDRSIRAILVTDIVGSTAIVERIGDRAWVELLSAHDRAIREELVVFSGEEIDTTGDGFVVSFDSPTRAIRC